MRCAGISSRWCFVHGFSRIGDCGSLPLESSCSLSFRSDHKARPFGLRAGIAAMVLLFVDTARALREYSRMDGAPPLLGIPRNSYLEYAVCCTQYRRLIGLESGSFLLPPLSNNPDQAANFWCWWRIIQKKNKEKEKGKRKGRKERETEKRKGRINL